MPGQIQAQSQGQHADVRRLSGGHRRKGKVDFEYHKIPKERSFGIFHAQNRIHIGALHGAGNGQRTENSPDSYVGSVKPSKI